jgi:hypothetical protein
MVMTVIYGDIEMPENTMPPLTQVDLDRMNKILSWQYQVDELKKENATLKDMLAAYSLYVVVSVERHEWPADIDTWIITQSEAPEWQAWLTEDRRTRELAKNAAAIVEERNTAYRERAAAEYQLRRALSYADHSYNQGHIGEARLTWEQYLRA